MDMIINGLAGFVALAVFATFVAQFLAPLRHSALWAAPAAAPLRRSELRRSELRRSETSEPSATTTESLAVDLGARRRTAEVAKAQAAPSLAA